MWAVRGARGQRRPSDRIWGRLGAFWYIVSEMIVLLTLISGTLYSDKPFLPAFTPDDVPADPSIHAVASLFPLLPIGFSGSGSPRHFKHTRSRAVFLVWKCR